MQLRQMRNELQYKCRETVLLKKAQVDQDVRDFEKIVDTIERCPMTFKQEKKLERLMQCQMGITSDQSVLQEIEDNTSQGFFRKLKKTVTDFESRTLK